MPDSPSLLIQFAEMGENTGATPIDMLGTLITILVVFYGYEKAQRILVAASNGLRDEKDNAIGLAENFAGFRARAHEAGIV